MCLDWFGSFLLSTCKSWIKEAAAVPGLNTIITLITLLFTVINVFFSCYETACFVADFFLSNISS